MIENKPTVLEKLGSQGATPVAAVSNEQRRKELADFLRTRRERLKPEQVGIHQGARRRTPGLRREEVAELAGVGTTWYTWLEQARDIQPSVEVLSRLGHALLMTSAEVRHMFILAGKAPPNEVDTRNETVSPSLQRMIDHGFQAPALVLGYRWDIIGANQLAKPIWRQQDGRGPNSSKYRGPGPVIE